MGGIDYTTVRTGLFHSERQLNNLNLSASYMLYHLVQGGPSAHAPGFS